jgi:hypothetical protein
MINAWFYALGSAICTGVYADERTPIFAGAAVYLALMSILVSLSALIPKRVS